MQSTESIYLNIYNFTPFNCCLNSLGIGAYHTGVQIKGIQFCYCVIDTQEQKTGVIAIEPGTAEYQFYKKIFLGKTSLKKQKIQKIVDELSEKYKCGNYHMFKYNCNHFSEEFVFRLLGIQLPRWIFRSTNCLRYFCICLPQGFVSGKWAVQYLNEQEFEKQQNQQ